MSNKYECWGESELIEKLEKMEEALRVVVRDFDFNNPKNSQVEIIRILDEN